MVSSRDVHMARMHDGLSLAELYHSIAVAVTRSPWHNTRLDTNPDFYPRPMSRPTLCIKPSDDQWEGLKIAGTTNDSVWGLIKKRISMSSFAWHCLRRVLSSSYRYVMCVQIKNCSPLNVLHIRYHEIVHPSSIVTQGVGVGFEPGSKNVSNLPFGNTNLLRL